MLILFGIFYSVQRYLNLQARTDGEKTKNFISIPRSLNLKYNRPQGPQFSDEDRKVLFWDITPCSPLKSSQRFGGRS
jgi:hypothetical protein